MKIESKSKFEQWWSQLVLETEREFVSPYSVDECVKRLKALDEKFHKERSSFFRLFSIYIKDFEDEGEFVSFKMSISMSKVMLSAELFGQLISNDESTTQVKLRLGYTLVSVLCLALLIPFMFIISISQAGMSAGTLLFAAGFGIFILVMQISFGYGLKPELYHEIHKELAGEAKAVNPV